MAFHPLLDWRLGLDMVRLALDAAAPVDLNLPYWSSFVGQVVPPYLAGLNLSPSTFGPLQGGLSTATNEAFIIVHPLWDPDAANYRPEIAAAVAQAQHRGLRPVLRSVFHAVRFPYE
jgi:hypothetical protein